VAWWALIRRSLVLPPGGNLGAEGVLPMHPAGLGTVENPGANRPAGAHEPDPAGPVSLEVSEPVGIAWQFAELPNPSGLPW
jgi:hypothetical protein